MNDAIREQMDRLVRERDEARAERDALAAHVEALVAWADAYVGTTGLYEEVESARNANTTSLARRDAEVIASLRFPIMLRKMWSGGEVQQWLDNQAEGKRIQAEEGRA